MVRDDLADVELADRIFAPHYARALNFVVTTGTAVSEKPKPGAAVVGSIEPGETVEVFDFSGGWAWLRSAKVIGYIPADVLALP